MRQGNFKPHIDYLVHRDEHNGDSQQKVHSQGMTKQCSRRYASKYCCNS